MVELPCLAGWQVLPGILTSMKLTFYGGAKMVTGSNYLLEHEVAKIIIDCGMHQGSSFCEKHNWDPLGYDTKDISAVFVTHAHIDHTGRLPKLIKDGYKGPVYSTPPTRDAGEFLLADSDHILAQSAERFKKPLLYDHDDIMKLMRQWEGIPYHKEIVIGPFTVIFYNAGHIIGSSFLVVSAGGEHIVFSGDLGNSPAPLIGTKETYDKGTYALMESTYGGRIHEDAPRRKEMLEKVIEETIQRGGTLMIPSFAMERTQALLFEIDGLIRTKRIPSIPIFLDSPLAIRLTDVYRKYDEYLAHTPEHPAGTIEGHTFRFPHLTETMSTDASKSINFVPAPKIIVAGSGMSHAGRILHHEQRYLSDPKSTLLIIGYQAEGSLGRRLLDGVKSVKIHREVVPVRATIRAIGGYSAHADQKQLLEWIAPMKDTLKKIFLVQGEEDQAIALGEKIKSTFAIETQIPSLGDTVVL